jgi:hypothetical protein
LLEPKFGIGSKGEFLKLIEQRDLIHGAMNKVVLQSRVYNYVSIIVSHGKNNGLYKNVPFNSEQWITNIYKRENKNWICIMINEASVS